MLVGNNIVIDGSGIYVEVKVLVGEGVFVGVSVEVGVIVDEGTGVEDRYGVDVFEGVHVKVRVYDLVGVGPVEVGEGLGVIVAGGTN